MNQEQIDNLEQRKLFIKQQIVHDNSKVFLIAGIVLLLLSLYSYVFIVFSIVCFGVFFVKYRKVEEAKKSISEIDKEIERLQRNR